MCDVAELRLPFRVRCGSLVPDLGDSMRNIGLAGTIIATALLIAPASNAADIARPVYKAPPPAPVVYNWSGFYIGGNLGYGWGDGRGDRVGNDAPMAGAIAAGIVPLSFGVKPEGVLGGGQIGYNWQFAERWVLGVEADLQASGVKDSTAFVLGPSGLFPSARHAGSEDLKWFGTVRGRLGYAFDRVLLYATGGLAYGKIENTGAAVSSVAVGGAYTGSASNTNIGWTVGGGLEWAFAGAWSVKAEYLYVDLGSDTVRQTDPVFAGYLDYEFKHQFHIARVGLNYKFDTGKSPVVAKY